MCYQSFSQTFKFYRIAKFAFDYATKNGRKKVLLEQYMKIFKYIQIKTTENIFDTPQVTAVHKANIMKLGDGLFLRF